LGGTCPKGFQQPDEFNKTIDQKADHLFGLVFSDINGISTGGQVLFTNFSGFIRTGTRLPMSDSGIGATQKPGEGMDFKGPEVVLPRQKN
jgi:hypothetical protein